MSIGCARGLPVRRASVAVVVRVRAVSRSAIVVGFVFMVKMKFAKRLSCRDRVG